VSVRPVPYALRALDWRGKPRHYSNYGNRGGEDWVLFSEVRQFLRGGWLRVVAISLVLLTPCFWHPRIEAGDLPSHVYNAWLAQLIEKGQAPGLYLVNQWNNVALDRALLQLGNVFGLVAAEKIAASLSVLIFFWGTFALLAAVAQRAPWFLLPCLAMLAYGWTFNIGFFNYYISLGLGFFATAIFWRGRGRELIAGFVFAGAVLVAHPQGFAWLAGCVGYILLWRVLPGWWKLVLLAGAAAATVTTRLYLFSHDFGASSVFESFGPGIYNGTDQIDLYSMRSHTLSFVALGFGLLCFVADAVGRGRNLEAWRPLRLPFELHCIAVLATYMLPDDLKIPLFAAGIGAMAIRLTTVSAVMGLAVLAQMQPRKWHTAGFGAIALVSFAFLYQDTGVLSRMEEDAGRLVSKLPQGQRVLATIWPDDHSRLPHIVHLVDRACVGKCFVFQNYEPASGQFRVRVRAGSPVATDNSVTAEKMEAGEYIVRERDLPISEIYQCDENDPTKLCLLPLAAGELNGVPGYRPPR
jgi:hypothetical protein